MAVNDVSIVGGPFRDYVNKQIDVRQKIHASGFGKTNRTSNEIQYLNGNSSWVRAASSVYIQDPKRLVDIGFSEQEAIDQMGIGLASKYVLNGGTSQYSIFNNDLNLRQGINLSKSGVNSGAYQNTSDFGIQAMPGITNFSVAHNNLGSIRTGTLTLRANSLLQFNILELLYIRLGYTILVEWGHSLYFDNDEGFSTMGPTLVDSGEKGWFAQQGTTHLEFYEKIEKIKEEYQGNYDAFFCKVRNFQWNFTPEGYYNIELDLISLGDVIESVTVNRMTTNNKVADTSDENAEVNINSLKNFLYCSRVEKFTNDTAVNEQGELTKDFVDVSVQKIIKNAGGAQAFNNVYTKESQYVRLGAFLGWLQDNVLPTYINEEKPESCIVIDTRLENYMMNFPGLISADPRICVINNDLPLYKGEIIGDIERTKSLFRGFADINPTANTDESRYRGIIMNIYLNYRFIDELLSFNSDSTNQTYSLFTFINNLCQGINSCFGGYIDLQPSLPTDDGKTLYILDRNLDLRVGKDGNIIDKKKVSTTFEVYGFGEETSNFVKNFSFNTKISKELASMVSIGATANNESTEGISDFFNNLNRGLQDRFAQKMVDGNTESTGSIKLKCFDGAKLDTEQGESYKAFLADLQVAQTGTVQSTISFDDKPSEQVQQPKLGRDRQAYIDRLLKLFGSKSNFKSLSDYFDVSDKDVEKNRSVISEFIKTFLQTANERLKKEQSLSSSIIGFIPIEIDLTVKGLAGMKLYEQVILDSKFLPQDYASKDGNKKVEFIVKGLTHSVQNNEWVTTISALSKPTGNLVNVTLEKDNEKQFKEDVKEAPTPELIFATPTGFPIEGNIRNDDGGFGFFGASRGSRVHTGIDLSTTPGDSIYAPIPGIIQKSKSFAGSKLPGFKIIGSGRYKGITAFVFYAQLLNNIRPGDFVEQDDYVAQAVSISKPEGDYSKDVTDHIHFKVEDRGKEVNPEKLNYI